jgi:hypothetical protein
LTSSYKDTVTPKATKQHTPEQGHSTIGKSKCHWTVAFLLGLQIPSFNRRLCKILWPLFTIYYGLHCRSSRMLQSLSSTNCYLYLLSKADNTFKLRKNKISKLYVCRAICARKIKWTGKCPNGTHSFPGRLKKLQQVLFLKARCSSVATAVFLWGSLLITEFFQQKGNFSQCYFVPRKSCSSS